MITHPSGSSMCQPLLSRHLQQLCGEWRDKLKGAQARLRQAAVVVLVVKTLVGGGTVFITDFWTNGKSNLHTAT